jgi:hypothetical protein
MKTKNIISGGLFIGLYIIDKNNAGVRLLALVIEHSVLPVRLARVAC